VTVELRPLGVTCNIQCQYCYQNPQRDAGNFARRYDLEKMKAAAEREGRAFSLFGGEPLLVREADLEDLWSWGFEKFGRNAVQTNGTLITDGHIALFKKYNVSVGISVDGPDEFNDVRWMGTLERTRSGTAATHQAIQRVLSAGVRLSLIATLHRCNATRDKLPRMRAWFRDLEELGLTAARLHVLESESEHIRATYGLSVEENVEALLSFYEFERHELKTLRFDIFRDMRNLLLGSDGTVSCVWNACDPYTTRAVRGIEGSGQATNCGRTNKDGIDFVKGDVEGFERYLALYATPQRDGGCKGCRFFLMCKGQCPGTAIGGDWRNRSEYCEVWKQLFHHLERNLRAQGYETVSSRADRKDVESVMLESWASGRNMSIAQALRHAQSPRTPATGLTT
jgi:radical SAM protein with 4Fe4S-binding SPASM domain